MREFVNRFRGILGIPDRAIAHLDDFDHPLSEASVRQIAGGLLDLIVQDRGYSTGVDPEDIEMIEDKREELRHYADLARFAQVYKEIADPLNLKMPPAESERDRNDRAVRALLDLGENDPAPSWAFESTGPSRRAAASRLPSPSEVVRMLMALIEHVIHLEGVRVTMDPAIGNPYNDYVRKNVQYNREENARWETEKKSLMAARVRCKSAEQTRANKAKVSFNCGVRQLTTVRRSSAGTPPSSPCGPGDAERYCCSQADEVCTARNGPRWTRLLRPNTASYR